jgi:uncharacterized protein YkwD
MRTTFAIAAIAGSAIAAPSFRRNGHSHARGEVKNVHLIVETVVTTVYVTEAYEAAVSTSYAAYPAEPVYSVQPIYSPPAAVTTVVYEAPVEPSSKYEEPAKPSPAPEAPKPTPVYEEPKYTPAPEAPKYTPAPEAPKPEPTPAPAESGYMAIVSEYRQKLGLPALEYSQKLQDNAANAASTCLKSDGSLEHKMNPGTYAQTAGPTKDGSVDSFHSVFVGGWLCERANLPAISAECAALSGYWMHSGTGHVDIIMNTGYTQVGCGWANGAWVCDFA